MITDILNLYMDVPAEVVIVNGRRFDECRDDTCSVWSEQEAKGWHPTKHFHPEEEL